MLKPFAFLPDLDKMPNVNKGAVFHYITKLNRAEIAFRYVTNSKLRKAINLVPWLASQLKDKTLDYEATLLKGKEDAKVKTALSKFRNGGYLTYIPDDEQYKMTEYWATAVETYTSRKGDCDDGAVLLYVVLRKAGVPMDRLYVVAGDVVGGGHCYVVYIAENGLEYAIDWCYWPLESLAMSKPYRANPNYFNGEKEWVRFNEEGNYNVKK